MIIARAQRSRVQWDAYAVGAVLAWRERPFRFSDEIEEDARETELDEMR
jgi:hypothetical protein